MKHAIDLQDYLALEAEVYEPALEEGLDGEGDVESAEAIENADVHLALDVGLDVVEWLGRVVDVMLGVTVFYGGIEDGKTVDVGSVGFVEFPEEVGENRCLEFGLGEEGEALRVGPWKLFVAEMEVMRENGIAKMLTLLVIHQSILNLSVSLVDLDDLPQQDQLAVFSLLRLPRNRKRPIDRIAAHDGLIDVIQALSDIFLHNKPKQSNRVLIFPQSIHPVNLHQLPYELMIKNEAILILNNLLLHQLLKYPVEPLLNEIYNLRISVDLAGLLLELSGDQCDHEGEETQGDGLEVGLKQMDDHVLNACPFQLLLLDMSETLVIAHQGHQGTLVQREVLELVPNYVLEQRPADGFQFGGGEVCSHLECDQEVDFAGGREIVKAFIDPEVRVYPCGQCCIIRVRAVERAYDIQRFFVDVANLGVEVGLELVDIVRAPTRSMTALRPFPVLCLPPIMLVNSKSDTILHRSAHPSHDTCQHHHPLIIIQVSIKLDSSMSDH